MSDDLNLLVTELARESAGAHFVRADLHIHSFGKSGSYEVSDTSMTPEQIVETAIKENLKVISIADHNSIENVSPALKHAEGKNILVIPAVELSTPQGHLLVYCPTLEQLQAFYGKLSIPADKKTCGNTFEQCLELAEKYGGFGIAAHMDRDGGFELEMAGYDPFKEKLFCIKNLLALEITNVASSSWYTDEDENAERKRFAKKRREVLGLEENSNLPKVMGSDAHTLNVLGHNASGAKKLTRFKMETLTFESLRIALHDPDARVRIEDLIPTSVPYFLGMRLEGGFLDNQKIRFSKNLTCIIGGRGTGKSTTLESLRSCSGNNSNENLVDSDVWADRISLVYRDEVGRDQLLIKDKGREAINVSHETDGVVQIPIESYGQGETAEKIQHSGKNPAILLAFLDEFANLGDLQSQDQQICQKLLENQSEIEKGQLEVGNIPAIEKAQAVAVAQLKTLKAQDAKNVVELEEKLALGKRFRVQLGEQLASITSSVSACLAESSDLDWVTDTDGSSLVVGADELEKVKFIVQQFSSKVATISTNVQKESADTLAALNAELRVWATKESEALDKIEIIRKELAAKGIPLDLAFIRKVTADVAEYGQKLAQLKLSKARLEAARKTRMGLCDQRKKLKAKLHATRHGFATTLNSNLKSTITDYLVNLKFREGCLSTEMENLLKTSLSWRTTQVPRANLISQNISPLELADAISQQNFTVLESVKDTDGKPLFSADEVRTIYTTLSQAQNLFALQRCAFDDLPELTVTKQVTKEDGTSAFISKPFSKLSLGQQQSLLLSIMLFSKKNCPLIIDQPEDNLDSEFIYKTFVQTLRRVKETRQIIVVTHNANIAVLGDAELIIPLKSTHETSRIFSRGSIDNAETKKIACQILEGSDQAFKRRQKIYGF